MTNRDQHRTAKAATKRKRRRDDGTVALRTEDGCIRKFAVFCTTKAEANRLSWRKIQHTR